MVQGRRWCSVTRHRVVALSCVAACCRARLISEFREFNEFRDVRAMPATNQVSDVLPLYRAARSLTSQNSLNSLNSLLTARYHDAPKLSQAFSAVLSRAGLCGAVRSSLASEGLQMWCQVEVWLDGGVLERTSPFRRTSLVPQMRRYHAKLNLLSEGRQIQRSANFESMGCT